ncbi:MAG: translation initiation factor IF-6 [Thermoprotei archaeon]
MEIDRIRIFGTPHIGVYIFANNSIALVPPGLERKILETISDVLKVDIIETKIAGSILVGVLVTGNDNGVILPRNIREEEYTYLRKTLSKYGINVYITRSYNTALGNLFLVNNRAGIVGTDFERDEVSKVSDTLGIDIIVKNIMELTIPGSLAVINDHGGVVHPDISDKELEELRNLLGIFIERATVNSGIPFIKSGLVANNKGILVGEATTGPEILRIRRGFEGKGSERG